MDALVAWYVAKLLLAWATGYGCGAAVRAMQQVLEASA